MKVLITGATGFAGRHLSALALAKKGAKVYGLVHAGSPKKPVPGVKPVHADLLSKSSMVRALKKLRPDRIYHLAGQASVADSWKEPKKTFDVNVGGTKCLIEAALAACPEARLLVAGSAEEYGAAGAACKKLAEDAPLKPLSPYGASKLAQSLLAQQAYSGNGLWVARTRSFNHFGPGQDERFVVPSFARQIAEIEAGSKKAEIRVGNLNAVRDFTDVRDVAEAYWFVLEKGEAGEVYNIASGRGHKVEDILRFFLRASSVRIRVRRDPSRMRSSDVPFLVGDARKLAAAGWKPRRRFERTLRDVLDEWRKKIGRKR